jgi:hypothetical protein
LNNGSQINNLQPEKELFIYLFMHSTINTNTTLTNRDLDGTKVQMTNSEAHCIK